ncbi:uncharacterized protein LOC133193354 [Saccostrea echinata]|uniref:uncharacterized protein LOC133193354 n=1 Tax=Saccostrea echinata TaxID=191078 RepID=UPI002A8086CD|nr:uncharacterized protein LOC133193354 [Saccostrea echinata]
MRGVFVVLFGCGFLQLVSSQCRTIQKSNENWGCFYNGEELEPGQYFEDPDTCDECTCLGGGYLSCCANDVNFSDLSPDCVVVKEGCKAVAVLKSDKSKLCPEVAFTGRK